MATALAFLAAPVFAQSELEISAVRTMGSGCPPRSVTVLVAGSQAAVLYSAYSVTGSATRSRQTRNCNVSIELRVPDRVTVSATGVDWSGIVALEPESAVVFERRFFFGAARNVSATTRFRSAGIEPFLLQDDLSTSPVSGCRQQRVMLRANTALTLMGIGTASVDSADVAGAAIRIGLRLGSC
jgi:hypothetical protein